MVYNIKTSNGLPLVSIPDSTQDTQATSLTLPGRNAVNYGLSVNQNFVNLLQNFANTTSPANPLQGQIWFDSINNDLKVYDGTKWTAISSGFDTSSGVTVVKIGPNNVDITLTINNYQIIMAVSASRVQLSDCPNFVNYGDVSYAFSSRFPTGIFPGINLAIDPANQIKYLLNGISTYANVLVNARTIFLNGVATGQVKFDGSSNVNVVVSDSNVFVNNTNVTVAGTWSKVLVSPGGRVLAGNTIAASDVVSALGYTPYNGGNISVFSVGNTVVARDVNANFAANVIICDSIITNKQIISNIQGTASNALALTNPRTIYLSGDTYGNVVFDGSSNVVINSNLITTGVTAGTYNLVRVDAKGRVTNGGYYDQSPFNSILIFPSDGYIPTGWTECNGSTVVDVITGTVTVTPNLVSSSSNLSVNAGRTLKYYIKYLSGPPSSDPITLSEGTLGTGTPIFINGEDVSTSSLSNFSVGLSGGPLSPTIDSTTTPLTNNTTTNLPIAAQSSFSNTNFSDVTYYDAVSLIMALGDPNAIMFSTYDVWNNLASLTIQDVIDNLSLRASENLPAFAGAYMLPVTIIRQQLTNLAIPTNFAFTPILQDQLMSSITSTFAHQLIVAGIPPVDNNLFGCHYFGSAAAYIELAKSSPDANVKTVLQSAGFFTSTTSQLQNYTRSQFFNKFAEIVDIAKAEVLRRKLSGSDIISSGQWTSNSNANVITTGTVNGYHIGNSDFVDLQGGYFPEYDILNQSTDPNVAVLGSSVMTGSAGTVSMSWVDASAAALAGVLQTDNFYDQAGMAQVCVNRTAVAAGSISSEFSGKNGFDSATTIDAFSGLSAAIYGPNADTAKSNLYGELFINKNILRSVLSIGQGVDFKIALAELFSGSLTSIQVDRVDNLRYQVYINGPELAQAQAAIGPAVNYNDPNSVASDTVIKPFGSDAYGYVTISPISGFYIVNSIEAVESAAAPSPDALLNRLKSLLAPVVPSSNANITAGNQSNTVVGGNVVTNTNVTTTTTTTQTNTNITNQTNQPSGGNTSGSPPLFIRSDGTYFWWSPIWW